MQLFPSGGVCISAGKFPTTSIYNKQECLLAFTAGDRELKQNSRGRQRRQDNKTNYTRQKAHVNM